VKFGNFLKRTSSDSEKVSKALEGTRNSWVGGILSHFKTNEVSDAFWEDLEELLILADVGPVLALRLVEDVRGSVKRLNLETPAEIEQLFRDRLLELVRSSQEDSIEAVSFLESHEGIAVISVVGVNGAGKTTSVGKLAHLLVQQGKKVMLAGTDTFRAAATEQLRILGSRAGCTVITNDDATDPGGVAFDAANAAIARGADVLILDTAGRLHNQRNLMAELEKIHKVVNRIIPGSPHFTLVVIDAHTGQNGIIQAKTFASSVRCDGVLLSKMDGSAKGGIVLAIADQLKIPVALIGTGESIDDLAQFDANSFVDSLLMP
jgi:fused signal recognition particle receptor